MITDETRKKWNDKIQACMEVGNGMSCWEYGFIDSIEMQRSEGKDLSMKQSKKLNELYEKYVV